MHWSVSARERRNISRGGRQGKSIVRIVGGERSASLYSHNTLCDLHIYITMLYDIGKPTGDAGARPCAFTTISGWGFTRCDSQITKSAGRLPSVWSRGVGLRPSQTDDLQIWCLLRPSLALSINRIEHGNGLLAIAIMWLSGILAHGTRCWDFPWGTTMKLLRVYSTHPDMTLDVARM